MSMYRWWLTAVSVATILSITFTAAIVLLHHTSEQSVAQSIRPVAAFNSWMLWNKPASNVQPDKHQKLSTTSNEPIIQSSNPYQCSSQPFPPSPWIDRAPLIEHWRMCPLAHRYPYLHGPVKRVNGTIARAPKAPRFDYPDISRPAWDTEHQWADPAYPRIFLIDPMSQFDRKAVKPLAYALFVTETVYDAKPGYWTSIATIQSVNLTNGDLIPGGYVQGGHPMPNIDYLQTIVNQITCSDTISMSRQPVEVEYSYFYIRLHCPFASRPETPASIAKGQYESSRSAQSSSNSWAQTADNYDASTMIEGHRFAAMNQLRFYHPLFITARPMGGLSSTWDMQPVNQALADIYQLRKNGTISPNPDWLTVAADGLLSPASHLAIPLCMSCVPRVDVTLCSAPMLNDAHVNDLHAHIQYHVALGVQKFVIYDRNAVYGDVVRPYVESGLVEYVPFPLPWRNTVTRQLWKLQAHLHASDQTTALESCRLRSVGVSKWIVYKDFDEWLTFPSNGSFINQQRTARCYSAEWRETTDSMKRATGAQRYVHMNVGIEQAGRESHRGDTADVWSGNATDDPLMHARDSLYACFQPDNE
ncbi:hypothetical protein HDU85_001239, partial [Gaertneriomyces sp. JEL0708]